jgi:hypothetical protein
MVTKAAILALLTQPSAETYGALLRAVTEEAGFNLHADDLDELWQQFETGDFAGVKARLHQVMALWMHNPEIHVLAYAVAKRLGDAHTAEMEGHFAACCYHGMQASGDGSFERPYQVARVPDEYALLRHLKKTWTRQGMQERDGRVIDAFVCTDGAVLHFELPDADLLTGKLR